MKRKVQAQRKFAQGAYIPPSASLGVTPSATSDRRSDALHANPHNVFCNSMTATSLLDTVAFQSMHSHKVAVVVLKRLEAESLPISSQNGDHRRRSDLTSPMRSKAAPLSSPVAGTSKAVRHSQRFRNVLPRPSQGRIRCHTTTLSEVKKRKPSIVIEESDIEDEKPLKYFVQRRRSSSATSAAAPPEIIKKHKVTLSKRRRRAGKIQKLRASSVESVIGPKTRAATRARATKIENLKTIVKKTLNTNRQKKNTQSNDKSENTLISRSISLSNSNKESTNVPTKEHVDGSSSKRRQVQKRLIDKTQLKTPVIIAKKLSLPNSLGGSHSWGVTQAECKDLVTHMPVIEKSYSLADPRTLPSVDHDGILMPPPSNLLRSDIASRSSTVATTASTDEHEVHETNTSLDEEMTYQEDLSNPETDTSASEFRNWHNISSYYSPNFEQPDDLLSVTSTDIKDNIVMGDVCTLSQNSAVTDITPGANVETADENPDGVNITTQEIDGDVVGMECTSCAIAYYMTTKEIFEAAKHGIKWCSRFDCRACDRANKAIKVGSLMMFNVTAENERKVTTRLLDSYELRKSKHGNSLAPTAPSRRFSMPPSLDLARSHSRYRDIFNPSASTSMALTSLIGDSNIARITSKYATANNQLSTSVTSTITSSTPSRLESAFTVASTFSSTTITSTSPLKSSPAIVLTSGATLTFSTTPNSSIAVSPEINSIHTVTSANVSTIDEQDEPIYFDCFPDNEHVIQLTDVNKPVIRSRLVKRSQTTIVKEFNLIEHEALLDRLLNGNVPSSDTMTKEPSTDCEQPNPIATADHSVPSVVSPPCNISVVVCPPASESQEQPASRVTMGTQTVTDESQSSPEVVSTVAQGLRSKQITRVSVATRSTSVVQQTSTPDIACHRQAQSEGSGSNDDINTERPVAPEISVSDQQSSTINPQAGPSAPSSTRRGRPRKKISPTQPSTSRDGLNGPHCSRDFPAPNSSQNMSTDSNTNKIIEAPVFYPTEDEFSDPVAYFEKIAPTAAKFGLCKVVPPKGFEPTCKLRDDFLFSVANQYIPRLYTRWGPSSREFCTIKAYLATQSFRFHRAPLYAGVEVSLHKLYLIVQALGGLRQVLTKKKWDFVAERLGFLPGSYARKRLDHIYVKYLLPYDTITSYEHSHFMRAVDRCWHKKNQKMMERAMKPLHRQRRLFGESDSSEDDEEEEHIVAALKFAEDCILPGRPMNLKTFKKVATQAMRLHFGSKRPNPAEVEKEYWQMVLMSTDHVCVNSASIDTGDEGLGFAKNHTDPYWNHPWNLKMVSRNPSNVLSSLGPVLGVTVPTLHAGMLYSTSCWHRDPHGLPWIEYMHSGPGKIWYGIPNEQSKAFRKTVEILCPAVSQNKTIWLPSDLIMIPPKLLYEHNVQLARVVQNPGEFIIVCPKAYSSSICTGYTLSESVYFATTSWLNGITNIFQDARECCEPTMFAIEQLLIAIVKDDNASLGHVANVFVYLNQMVTDELSLRGKLRAAGIKENEPQGRTRLTKRQRSTLTWNVRDHPECEVCRATLFLSMVTGIIDNRSTFCLHHARRLLECPQYKPAKNQPPSNVELIIYYTDAELKRIVTEAAKRINE